MPIAVLFADADGIYSRRAGVDVWHRGRDARHYIGPDPIVGHPPCERWCSLWPAGGHFGEDEGCFVASLFAVERFGGVIEHPAGSGAWKAYGLPIPELAGGWRRIDGRPGWSCHVEQGHYGHRARKATWLYYVGSSPPPPLTWGPSPQRGVWITASPSLPAGFVTCRPVERRATPAPFAELLLSLAAGCTCRDGTTWSRDASLELHDASSSRRDGSTTSGDASPRDVSARSCDVSAGAATFPQGPAPVRRCAWCEDPLAEGTRSHAITCSKRCRQMRQRWEAQGRPARPGPRHFRVVGADEG